MIREVITSKILKMYRCGEKIEWIAHVVGCSHSFVSIIAIQNGLRRRIRRTKEQIAEERELRETGRR